MTERDERDEKPVSLRDDRQEDGQEVQFTRAVDNQVVLSLLFERKRKEEAGQSHGDESER